MDIRSQLLPGPGMTSLRVLVGGSQLLLSCQCPYSVEQECPFGYSVFFVDMAHDLRSSMASPTSPPDPNAPCSAWHTAGTSYAVGEWTNEEQIDTQLNEVLR
jgi:hypothetical protein